MRLFEYQEKSILVTEGIDIPESVLLNSEADISSAIDKLGLPLVMKAQVLSGGRGKEGGVQIVHTEEEAKEWYRQKISTCINGKKIETILAEGRVSVEEEYYVSFTIDKHNRHLKMLFSTSGGIDVEQVKGSGGVFTCNIQVEYGPENYQLIEIFSRAKVPKERWHPMLGLLKKLYSLFLKYDCMLLEINPLAWTKEDKLEILDVHFYVDDNALRRQEVPKRVILEMPEIYTQSWLKLHYGFDLVILNPRGTVALVTTGAGLSMATIDEMKSRNIEPINFADIRSGQFKGDPTKLTVILEQLNKYSNLKYIFVSIFAGITDLGEFAHLLLQAKNKVVFSNKVEWIIRLEGNNYPKAKQMLEQDGLFVTNSLEEAFQKIEGGHPVEYTN